MIEQIGASVKAVIHSDGKILLQLRDEKPNIYYPGVWGLFGGNVESNEKPIDALKRELLEEIELDIKGAKLLFSWGHYKYNSVLHFFSVPLTVELATLSLNEGEAMELFSIDQIRRIPTEPSLELNLRKIDEILFSTT